MKNKVLISVLLIFVSAVVFSQFALPRYEVVQAKRQHIADLSGTLSDALEIQQIRDELNVQYNQVPVEKRLLLENSAPLFSDEAVAQFFLDLETLFRNSRLPTTTRFSNTPPNTDGEIVVMRVTLFLETVQYNTLLRLINNIQSWGRSVRIQDISIRAANDDVNRFAVDATLELEVLFSKPIPKL